MLEHNVTVLYNDCRIREKMWWAPHWLKCYHDLFFKWFTFKNLKLEYLHVSSFFLSKRPLAYLAQMWTEGILAYERSFKAQHFSRS